MEEEEANKGKIVVSQRESEMERDSERENKEKHKRCEEVKRQSIRGQKTEWLLNKYEKNTMIYI